MDSAAHRTLFIPELLESILLLLTEQDVLLCQRVCRDFRDIIIGSSILQEQLFFRPLSNPNSFAGATLDDEQGEQCIINTLLLRRFWPWYKINAQDLNLGIWSSVTFDALHWNLNEWTFQAYARGDATWRRMQVSQSPIKTLRVWKIIRPQSGRSMRVLEGELACGNAGLKMGALYDLTEAHLTQDGDNGSVHERYWCAFGVYWGIANINDAVFGLPGFQAGQAPALDMPTDVLTEGDKIEESSSTQKRDTITLILYELEPRTTATNSSRSDFHFRDLQTEPTVLLMREWGSQFRSEARRQSTLR